MAAQLQLRVAKKKLNPDGVVALIAEIVRGAPSLPGAACVDQYQLYDELPGSGPEHQRERVKRAAACCAMCPVQAKCPTVVTSGSTSITVAVGVRRASAVHRTPADLRASDGHDRDGMIGPAGLSSPFGPAQRVALVDRVRLL